MRHLAALLCVLVATAAPATDADGYLHDVLDRYTAAPEGMQGDQPVAESAGNITQYEYLMALRNRSRELRISVVKDKILRYLGKNASAVQLGGNMGGTSRLNTTELFPGLFSPNTSDEDEIIEKMRSLYPSCDIPPNTDQELWKDEEIMNLFFNFDYMLDSKTANIASATLRLYKLSKNATRFSPATGDIDTSSGTEDEKLLRVSIYRYTKPLKRRRVKRVLSDSKVIPENARWVELNVKPAAKAWTKSRNLGLALLVEDQDGNMLRADKYFKGASCTIGTSTPKPIPTIVLDAARQSNELAGLRDGNASWPSNRDDHLPPTIDICVVELPENSSLSDRGLDLRMNACNLRRDYETNRRLADQDHLEGLGLPSARHIRHQRQHLAGKVREQGDPRSRLSVKQDDPANLTDGRSNRLANDR